MEANLRPHTAAASDAGAPWRAALFAAALVAGPALLFWHLHRLWNPNGAYAYGWVVPVLAAFLCKFRWDDRPAPSAPLKSAALFAIAFAMATLPARWLQEAAPERGICGWAYALATVGLALALISLAGGAAWLRWFGFPFGFILTAAPWPHGLEWFISNFLMRGTAGTTVEILCLIGVPSVQAGNLVHIETGVIDIDEACSGIRSLQAMVMIALFLGELFRLKPGRRVLLVGLGLAFTLVTNVLRSVALSTIGFGMGMGAVDRCHDAAGFAVLMLSLAGTLYVAFKLRPAMAGARIADRSGVMLPAGLGAVVLVWFAFVEVSVETWYRLHEPKWHDWSWEVQWPRDREGFHFIEVPARSLRLLMCDESHAAGWHEPDGGEWSVYWTRWNPGNVSAEAAKVHRPDVCLNAEGAVLEQDLGTRVSGAGPMRIPFHSYTFRLGDKELYVFFALCEEGGGGEALSLDPRFEGTGMIERALQGRRDVGEESLEVALSGYPSEASARAAFTARIGGLVQTGQGGFQGGAE